MHLSKLDTLQARKFEANRAKVKSLAKAKTWSSLLQVLGSVQTNLGQVSRTRQNLVRSFANAEIWSGLLQMLRLLTISCKR